jgi:hypothetical protein
MNRGQIYNYARDIMPSVIETSEIVDNICYYAQNDSQKTHFEEVGDIEDFKKIVDEGTEEFERMDNMYVFVHNAEQIYSEPKDLHTLPKVMEFKNKYPSLYRTFEVWAWG